MHKFVPLCACAAALVACVPARQTAVAKRPATRARSSEPADADGGSTPVDQLPTAVQVAADGHRKGTAIKTSRVQNRRTGPVYTVRLRDGRELEIAADGALIRAHPEFADSESNDDSRHP